MRRLFTVEIRYEVQVLAENDREAQRVTESEICEIAMDAPPDWVGAFETKHLPKAWKSALPYGGDGETTCEEYFPAPTQGKSP